MGKKGGHLKSALQSQQSRLKNKQKAEQAAQVTQAKAKKQHRQQEQAALASSSKSQLPKGSHPPANAKGKGKEKGKPVQATQRPIVPFKPTDRILLVGEGNFSFTRALIVHPPSASLVSLPPSNVTATAYDTEEECYEKYADAKEIVGELRERGVRVVFGVDATRLERSKALKGGRWDRVVFNFPHAGKGIADQDRNILSNQVLLLNFLSSASKILAEGPIPSAFGKKKRKKKGEDDEGSEPEVSGDEDEDMVEEGPNPRGTVLITLRNVVPYTQWDLPRLAKNPPPPQTASAPPYPRYTLLRSFKFHRNIWEGYIHRMTKGERVGGTGKTGEGGEDRTWEFYLPDSKL
ncbi:hypothetical protein FA13DRAFT_1760864 [Coprinellus micaceus]|uniref:25S rRNA (uridine-N(3))-methyltransferase BMT5-like domain-containing protein n=1 Tax=Coprinellus micaceus TaxID=71717 RepID=A0A4Y7TWJ8_COPMI|nr:hypothetical protein FA13DRAFT_1760864 [Coprinellus micaceus]